MLLNEICTTDVVSCGRDTTVRQAAEIMRRKHVGDLVIVDDADAEAAPVGLITDRDIVVKVLGNELDPSHVTVSQVMRTPVVVARETEDATDAIGRMRAHGVRRLPVLSASGKLIGIVTLDDLLKRLVTDTNSLLDVVTREQDRERRATR